MCSISDSLICLENLSCNFSSPPGDQGIVHVMVLPSPSPSLVGLILTSGLTWTSSRAGSDFVSVSPLSTIFLPHLGVFGAYHDTDVLDWMGGAMLPFQSTYGLSLSCSLFSLSTAADNRFSNSLFSLKTSFTRSSDCVCSSSFWLKSSLTDYADRSANISFSLQRSLTLLSRPYRVSTFQRLTTS